MSEEKGRPLPKFGDWDVNDPASAEGFTVIFNKARDEKKTGGKTESPTNVDPGFKQASAPVKKPPAQPPKMGSQFGVAALDSLSFLRA
ncbi:protein NOI4-like isoform X2 [Cynara cardunculus var. scolymus]|uniref:Pathogenic type III effector avirulence factor Avr cleavage site-containing protein n=1 Tax=Cynara cardunculus var. scolymus TaxID=59895 RepID=A0A103Y4G4_CYNCS|nr:protein NOI4-like isoform X2 [Cynara cardunculus var. scolymus]KVI02345.1 Pathogenic type III effector avirulence factor Avr cleavage site-containing protein [Cynara cardunculus var. scolymus]